MESGRRDRKAEQSKGGQIPFASRFAFKDRQCEFMGCKNTNFIPLFCAQALGFLLLPEKYTLMR